MIRALLFCGVFGCALAHAQTTPPDATTPAHGSERAEEAYLNGARLYDHQDLAGAQVEFARAVALKPDRKEYALALNLVRQNRIGQLLSQAAGAELTHNTAQAATLLAEARAIDPSDVRIVEHFAQPQAHTPSFSLQPDHSFARPIHIEPLHPEPQTFDLRGDVKNVVTEVAAAYGVKVAYDESVSPLQLRFQLEAEPYGVAMPILLHMTHLFSVPLDSHTILVAKDSEENHEKFDRQVEETIFVPASTQSQLNELTQIIKNVFDVTHVVISPTNGTIVLRAPEETIKAVNYTVADLIDGGAQVAITLRLYSVDKTITRSIGLATPTSVGAFSVQGEAASIVNANQSAVSELISSGAYVPTGNTVRDTIAEALYLVLTGVVQDAKVSNLVAVFGGGLTFFGVDAPGGASLNLALNSADTRALDDISVRVGDREETTLRVGERYPITVSTYSSGISSSTSSLLGNTTINGVSASALLQQYLGANSTATIPLIQYQDLGLTLKTTPTVLKSGLIEMHIDLKLAALEGASLNNIPILTNSNFVSDITLKDGATAIMLSNLTSSEEAAVSGLPGLGDLPGFAASAGGDRMTETDHSELILLVTPHLVRRRSSVLATRPYIFHTSVPQEY